MIYYSTGSRARLRIPAKRGHTTSVSGGFSEGVTLVLAALYHPGFWVDGNAFPVAPVMIAGVATLDAVTHTSQGVQGRGRKTRLNVNDIGEVLLVKARSVHRPLDIQAAVGSAQENVGNRGHDAGSAR